MSARRTITALALALALSAGVFVGLDAGTASAGHARTAAGTKTATAVTLADQQQNGVAAPLTPANGKVTLDVTETPTIVLVDSTP